MLGKRYLTARYSSGSVKLAWPESWRMRVVLGEDGALGRAGRPCISGLRISVYDVLAMLLNGISQDEVLEGFPELTRDDIMAAVAYAADREHRVYSLKVQRGSCWTTRTSLRLRYSAKGGLRLN